MVHFISVNSWAAKEKSKLSLFGQMRGVWFMVWGCLEPDKNELKGNHFSNSNASNLSKKSMTWNKFADLHIYWWHVWADLCFLVFISNKVLFLVEYVSTSALSQFDILLIYFFLTLWLFVFDTYESKVCFSSLISWLWQRCKHILWKGSNDLTREVGWMYGWS